MELRVNGAEVNLEDGATIAQVVESLGFEGRWVVAEHNGEPVKREDFSSIVLKQGDRLQIVRPVAGG